MENSVQAHARKHAARSMFQCARTLTIVCGSRALFLACVVVCALLHDVSGLDVCEGLPDCFLTAEQLISVNGFVPEQHTCRTPDGFLLSLHRITPVKAQKPTPQGTVLLQHGLLDASHTFLLNGRKCSLAFVLADAGYDVWLGNSRGNVYSNSHESLNTSQQEFWDWSWDQMARYDLPTMVGYIRVMANTDKVGLIAHSQGTLQTFAGLSLEESTADDLAQGLSVFIALAPVAYLQHMGAPLLRVLAQLNQNEIELLFGKKQFLPSTEFIREALPALCEERPSICESFACMVSGCDPVSGTHYNRTRWPVYAAHYPSGTSIRDMLHFGQQVRDGFFRRYDFGTAKANMKAYGSRTPPPYDLSNIRMVPISLITGDRDLLADPLDIERLVAELPPSINATRHVITDYDHAAFCWASDSQNFMFPIILDALKNANWTAGPNVVQ